MPICFGEDGLWMVNNKGITTTIAYTNIVRDALQCNALVKTCLKSLLKKSRFVTNAREFCSDLDSCRCLLRLPTCPPPIPSSPSFTFAVFEGNDLKVATPTDPQEARFDGRGAQGAAGEDDSPDDYFKAG